MRVNWLKRTAWILGLALMLGGLVWFGWPRPVAVDLAAVTRGRLAVTVDDEGKTRVRHIYTVSAPIAGKVLRISLPSGDRGISRHVGDVVMADETVVAVMQPMTPGFIDVRSREELEAAVASADAAAKQAEADVRRLQAALDFSRTELQRAQALARTQTISTQALDKAKFEVETSEAALVSAKAQLEVRQFTRTSLAARLIDPMNLTAPANPACCVQIKAPVTGRILRIIQDSEAVVQAGTPLIDIGDPADLEVVADLLSTDAVQIKVGAPVRIDGWGGAPMQGRVVRVDPAGFVKVSALGIEEQRVRTTIDFTDPPDTWSRLGHDYRVIVHVTVWNAEDVLRVPVGALFRQGDDWAVFAVKDGRASPTVVSIGHRNGRIAEILSGLSAGDRVILHPSDRIRKGVPVSEREGG
ncbi:HlyD family efflux transporter periplasmic adaptor subunit [Bradyrhizobium sediminis]|uniref:HlyD family efflux transporter periplasmic adaptor subunit n=1 Tax=Bradyrhizobium sediminis TaxID=2840469 RepID=A0A975RN92_9BRAD|nr:HlyD family efflux transporter periplasmic adaptor subunit [Bradyrhizobium sediminis]QWG13306.1 HlyD family efflux transporter periplasmic adaptor subunit [Bradyrhizobium sediminis]